MEKMRGENWGFENPKGKIWGFILFIYFFKIFCFSCCGRDSLVPYHRQSQRTVQRKRESCLPPYLYLYLSIISYSFPPIYFLLFFYFLKNNNFSFFGFCIIFLMRWISREIDPRRFVWAAPFTFCDPVCVLRTSKIRKKKYIYIYIYLPT